MILKPVLGLLQQTAKTTTKRTDIIGLGVRKSGNIERLSLVSKDIGDTFHLSSKSNPNSLLQNIIKPKLFPAPDEKELSLYKTCKRFKYFDVDDSEFTIEILPKKLKLCNIPYNEEVIFISNFHAPSGTIAGFSTLEKALYTDKMSQCSAMTIVDKANNLQVMVHLFPGYGEKSNTQIFEHIFSSIKDKTSLELSIVPGYVGGVSSQFLTNIAKKYAPKSKLNYYNFPSSKVVNFFERGLVLKEGQLSCCNDDYFINRKINPLESIVACECKRTHGKDNFNT